MIRTYAKVFIVAAIAAAVGCKQPSDEAPAADKTDANVENEAPQREDAGAREAKADAGSAKTDDDQLRPGTDEQRQILVRAKSAFLSDDWKEAEKYFAKLIETGPLTGPQVTAYIALGQIYRETERDEKALAIYEQLAERAPRIAEVQFVLARALAEQGEATRAIRAYRRTIKLEPNYLQAYVELGGLLAKAGKKEEAGELFMEYEKRVYELAQRLESEAAPPNLKLYILDIFSFISDDRANQAIISALDDPSPDVREKAVHLSAELGLGSVTERLEEMSVSDPNVRVRMAAKDAAKHLSGAPAEGSRPTFVREKESLP